MTGNSFYCSACVVNWNPYQCNDGACPLCGSGTVRRQEPASDDSDELYRNIMEDVKRRHKQQMFEEYYKKHCEEQGIEYEPEYVEA